MRLSNIILKGIICAGLLISACSSKNSDKLDPSLINNPISADGSKPSDLPNIKFDTTSFDFGNMTQGEIRSTEFAFENTGETDLVISDAKGSCGCTVPVFPKEPIKPGSRASIKVTFNSDGKTGIQNKTVTLITNCIPSTKFLSIKANVKTLH